jgi:hypothetical protein
VPLLPLHHRFQESAHDDDEEPLLVLLSPLFMLSEAVLLAVVGLPP